MGTNEHDENEDGQRTAATESTEQAPRRPYATPRVETYPLFERMALVCDPYMKNTGDDSFS